MLMFLSNVWILFFILADTRKSDNYQNLVQATYTKRPTLLKVPKCENLHRTDFFYFYTIKPLWVGDFRAKNKKIKILIFRGSFWGFFFENFVLAHTEPALKKIFFSSEGKNIKR
jgi:hypothetical protein